MVYISLDSSDSPNISGFAGCSAKKNEQVTVLCKGSITSDQNQFYTYSKNILNLFLKNKVNTNTLNSLLILKHDNGSTDIHTNNFDLAINVLAKRGIKKGEEVTKEDIANINSLSFPGIEVNENDLIIFIFRVGLKFGLYFNFMAEKNNPKKEKLNLESTYSELGKLYRTLLFDDLYYTYANKELSDQLFSDGWFPFLEIQEADYLHLSSLYKNKWLSEQDFDNFLKKFDTDRIEKITNKWWKKQQFKDKKELIKAGINAYLQDTKEGYITCCHTLSPQIEGIMGLDSLKSNKQWGTKEIINHLSTKGNKKFSEQSLGFPKYFEKYLNEIIFANYKPKDDPMPTSKHAITHGCAKSKDLNKKKALQLILTLNQIYFFL